MNEVAGGMPPHTKELGGMRNLLGIMAVLVIAGTAVAGPIKDVREGRTSAGSVIDASNIVVTAVQNNSFTVTEMPAGEYTAIWVYEGVSPAVSVGDVIDLKGLVRDNYGSSEINLLYPSDAGYTVTGTTSAPEIFLTTAEMALNQEAWESHVVTITDGMIVQEILEGGQWLAYSVETELPVLFDDYFFDYATVDLGDCYNNAHGLVTWYRDTWVFKVISTENVDCTVGNEDLSFGSVKSLYR
jgi:hypothetical protein